MERRTFLQLAQGAAMFLAARQRAFGAVVTVPQVRLPGWRIAQFVDPLPGIETIVDTGAKFPLYMREFRSPVMPTGFVPASGGTYSGTYVWGYRRTPQGSVLDTRDSFLGPVILAKKGTPTEIEFVNQLGSASPGMNLKAWQAGFDATLMWADPLNGEANACAANPLVASCSNPYYGPIPAVPHLHGGEVPSYIDGGPDAWFTGAGQQGHAFYTRGNPGPGRAIYRYPNAQDEALIWFHDHLLGGTRLNVYAGLAGGYFIDDPASPVPLSQMPELLPMVLQDRMFDTEGQLFFPNAGLNPEHPFWVPEFVGDVICVNGKVWPYKTVERKRYTFLLINGSNSRTYDLSFTNSVMGARALKMWVVGTDGGYLDKPVLIDPVSTNRAVAPRSLVILPGERYIVVVDFSTTTAGDIFKLENTARTPYPGGSPAVASTTGRVMQFRISTAPSTTPDTSYNPALVNPPVLRSSPIVRLANPATGAPVTGLTIDKKRMLTLNEIMGPGGPMEVLLNNTRYRGSSRTGTTQPGGGASTYYSEIINEGDIEQWDIINMTADAHPIHLHLAQFQLLNRQVFDLKAYKAAYLAAYPAGVPNMAEGPPAPYDTPNAAGFVGGNPDVTPYLSKVSVPSPPVPYEAGWKDTLSMLPGQVTRILVRWAPVNTPLNTRGGYPFSPEGHGYVWHCHIVDHEDNEMMRPTALKANGSVSRDYIKDLNY